MGKKRQSRPRLDPGAHIAIIGSGLAGLSTALSLEQGGFTNVHIYERDGSHDARKEGYGLTLTYNPTGVLHQLNVLEEIAQSDCPSRSHYMFNANGEIQGYFGNAFARNRGWGQRGNLRVPRQRVRQILASRLKITETHWDHKLVGVSGCENGENICLAFQLEGAAEEKLLVGADLVVAADGIRSAVLQHAYPQAPPIQSLGIRLILGISSSFTHVHLKERGFYTLDSGKRLFVMPFARTAEWAVIDDNATSCSQPTGEQYMWQLSFASSDDKTYSSTELLQQALFHCRDWHEPVQELMLSTSQESIWGTLLYDRNPEILHKHLQINDTLPRRILIVGDACHAMSPFKGQGANQALQDGRVLVKHLTSARVEIAVSNTQREIVQRTASVVAASRQASVYWHEPQLVMTKDGQDTQKFAGVCSQDIPALLHALQKKNIKANSANDLDKSVQCTIDELQLIGPPEVRRKAESELKEAHFVDLARQAILSSEMNNLAFLRKLSWEYPNLIRNVDVDDMTCLQKAARSGHIRIAHWLITEAGCLVDARLLNDLSIKSYMKALLKMYM
jgi:salicylate hydroxylase